MPKPPLGFTAQKEELAMSDLDRKVIEKILTDTEAMKIAKAFIQKCQATLQVRSADHRAFQEKP